VPDRGQILAASSTFVLAVALEAHLLGHLQVRTLVWSVSCVRQGVEGRRLVGLEDGLEGQETDRRLSRESRILARL
jgi:hypothetical protein